MTASDVSIVGKGRNASLPLDLNSYCQYHSITTLRSRNLGPTISGRDIATAVIHQIYYSISLYFHCVFAEKDD